MVRVRLEGLPDEVQRIADAMQAAGCVLERSREYPNRGESRYVRVYLDCDLPKEVAAMIEIDGVELRTAAQWEKKHRHVKKGQLGKGVERTWRSPNGNTTAMFYNIEQTRPWAKKDVEAVNRRRRADAKAKREADECGRIEGAARAEQHRKDLLDCWGAHIDEETLQEGRRDHTAYQWCDLGFVPIAEARWRLTRYGGNSAWYYCSPWDVRYDPDRAKELLETGPREYDRLPDGRPYDGRPWWQA